MKICSKCNLNKPFDQFYKKSNQEDGIDYYCKQCRLTASSESHRRKKHQKSCSADACKKPHYSLGFCRRHYERHKKGKPLNWRYESTAGNLIRNRRYRLKAWYKITLEEFELMAINGCQICGGYDERQLHVDHDHDCCPGHITCGQCVRGVVCHRCNSDLQKFDTGQMRSENPNKERVVKYIMRYRARVNNA